MFNNLRNGLFGNWNEFDKMFEELDRFFRPAQGLLSGARSCKVEDDSATIVLEVPGLDAKDLDVQVNDSVVTVSVEHEPEDIEGTVHLDEFRPLAGTRTYRLPFKVDPKKVKAVCKNGLLTLTLERAQVDKPKSIKVLAA